MSSTLDISYRQRYEPIGGANRGTGLQGHEPVTQSPWLIKLGSLYGAKRD